MQTGIKKILNYLGTYKGQGSAHNDEGFQGEFTLMPLLDSRGITVHYQAQNDLGELLHQEASTIAPDELGTLCLWNLNTNTPGLRCHKLTMEQYTTEGNYVMHFDYGELSQQEQFRERISITLHAGGAISYIYSWGLPHEAFGERSRVKLFQNQTSA